jgi:hypothetical protein
LLSPTLSAIDFRDQWVASRGVSSSVATTTRSTCSTVIDGGGAVPSASKGALICGGDGYRHRMGAECGSSIWGSRSP